MPTLDPTSPHIEGLLHLSAIAFAMTVAYLGLDKVGDLAREALQVALTERRQEIKSTTLTNEGLIIHLSELRNKELRLRLRRLLVMTKDVPHKLYEGWTGEWQKARDKTCFFFRCDCFIARLDRWAVGFCSIVCAVIFFALSWFLTFNIQITNYTAVICFVINVASIVVVAYCAAMFPAAKGRIEQDFANGQDAINKHGAAILDLAKSTLQSAAGRPIQ